MPLCIEGHDRSVDIRDLGLGISAGIGGSRSVGLRVPTIESMAEPGEGVCGQGLGHAVFESLVAHGSCGIRRVLGELHGIGVDGPLRIEGLGTHVGVGYHCRLTCGALGVGEPSAEGVAGLRDVTGCRQDRSVSEEVVRHVIAFVDRASVSDQGHVEPREEYR